MNKKEKAFKLGREAYINKKNRIVNQECISLLEEKPCKLNIEIMKNFYKGWDIENIEKISKCFFKLTEKNIKNGKVYERKIKSDKLIGVATIKDEIAFL